MTDEAFPEIVDAWDLSSSLHPLVERRVLGPLTVEANSRGFVIRTADSTPLAYVFFVDSQHQSSRDTVKCDEASSIAADTTAGRSY